MIPRGLAASMAAVALLLAGCAPGQQLPSGVETLDDLCPAYMEIVERVPLNIDGDQVRDGAIPAGESAIVALRTETAQLRAAVDPLELSETRAAFIRFVQETASALATAEREVQRIQSGNGWEDVQRELNQTILGADERLRDSMEDIDVNLEQACS